VKVCPREIQITAEVVGSLLVQWLNPQVVNTQPQGDTIGMMQVCTFWNSEPFANDTLSSFNPGLLVKEQLLINGVSLKV
jgi:hypothetical protein